jgi:hypothetical protein
MNLKKEKIKRQFITKSNIKHHNKYNYSKVEYENSITKVEIICSDHGSFWVRPDAHVRKVGCPKCKGGVLYTKEDFIEKVSLLYDNYFDYSNVDYINSSKKVEIICPNHGSFFIRPANHMAGQSCPSCSGVKRKNTKEFIEEALTIHSDKYLYNETIYLNNRTKVKIFCHTHGYFEQTPKEHLKGRGCPKCVIYLGEQKVEKVLKKYNISYQKQFTFDNLISEKGRKLPFDFYISDYNICIEYDGRQHYEPVAKFGGIETLKQQLKTDNIKEEYCINNNILLIRIQKKNEKIGIILLEKLIILNKNKRNNYQSINIVSFFKLYNNEDSIFNFILENYKGKYSISNNIINLYDINLAFRIVSNYKNNELLEDKYYSNNIKLEYMDNNIKLIQLYEDLWVSKNEIIKSRILNLLNLKDNKIYARNLKIKEISKKEANIFLEKNHLQGKLFNGTHFISLVDNKDNILSLMTFGMLRKNLGNKSIIDTYELLRFCNSSHINVIGSASKMLNYFINKYNPNTIISYADKNWTDIKNNIYIKLKFNYINETKTSYSYIIGRERKNRFKLRKNILVQKLNIKNVSDHTESEICKSLNIFRVYNCGSYKFELKVKNKIS